MNDFIITPIAGAIIGYFTNWLAIKMLFRPHTAKYIFGVKLPFTPGLMPSERHRLSKKIGETVAEHVLTSDMIKDSVMSEENMREIERGLRNFLNSAKEPAARMIFERFSELLEKLSSEGGVLAMLPANSMDVVEKTVYDNIPRLTGFIRGLPPEVSEKLIELTGKVIDEAVGKFVAAFINRERVYEGITNSLCEYLDAEENRAALSKRLSEQLAGFLENGVAEKLPWDMAAVEGFTHKLTDIVFDLAANEFLKSETVRSGLAQAIGGAVANIDVGKMAEEQINSMDMAQAEEIVLSVVKRELNAITVVGGVLGFIIGLVPGLLHLIGL